MNDDRRDFLKKSALALAAVAGVVGVKAGSAGRAQGAEKQDGGEETRALTPDGKLIRVKGDQAEPCCGHSDAPVRKGIPGRKWVMVIDLARCDGCKKCTEACGKMHFVPPEREWVKVFKMQDSPETAPYYFPKPCFHCDNPPCTKVCPVDATFKRQDGVVLIDNERCIGCRFCMAACPYSTRFFNWGRPKEPAQAAERPYSPERGYPRRVGTVEKCDFCPDMAAEGKLPACAATCPMAAMYYGDQNEDAVTNSKGETERFTKLIRDRAGYLYLEELGTKPRVYYLPPKSRMFPAPGEEQQKGGPSCPTCAPANAPGVKAEPAKDARP